MKLTYTKKVVKRKTGEYTVIIPDGTENFLNNKYIFDADREGLNAILMSVLLMTKRKDLIIYFPVMSNTLPDRYFPKANEYVVSEKARGDVVFFHHAAQIPVSDWKEIRRSLMFTKGIKAAFCADIDFEYRQCMKRYKDVERFVCTEKKDLFLFKRKFETFFFIGGRSTFTEFFIDLKKMLDLPLEENFKASPMNDYVFFNTGYGKDILVEFPELGFFDERLLPPRTE